MPKWPGFVWGSNTPQSLIADAERSVNLYTEPIGGARAATQESSLLSTPGFQMWSTVTDVGTRCLFVAAGRMFGIVGRSLYEWDSTGAETNRGTVASDANPAQIVYNGVVGGQLGIVSGGSVYSYDLTTNTLSAAHLSGGYTHLAYADGYGLAFNPITGRVILSALNNLASWSLGDFFQRSKFPDPWQAMFVDPNSLIWLIGPETFEVWYNTGVGLQPWAPLSGLVGRFGIAAPFGYGVSAAGNFWLARSAEGGASIVRTSGSIPTPISTYAVDTAINRYRRSNAISDAELLIYHDEGHTFANVSLAKANATWSYDAAGQGWAERGLWNAARGDYDVWAPRGHVDCFGKHLVGDRTTGTIWEMDSTFATDVDGTGIRRLRRAPAVLREHQRIAIDQLELLMDVGLGTAIGAGADPQALLRVSQDGGRTFGNERRASVGPIGQYRRRVYWTRLGANPDAVIEVVWSDPSPVRVVDCWINNAERAA